MAGNRLVFERGSIGAFSRTRIGRDLDGAAFGSVLATTSRIGDEADSALALSRATGFLASGGAVSAFSHASLTSAAGSAPNEFASTPGFASAPIDQESVAGFATGAAFVTPTWLASGNAAPLGADSASAQPASFGDSPMSAGIDAETTAAVQGETVLPGPSDAAETPQANEIFTVTQTTVLAPGGDTDGDGVIDPGETVLTTVTITNNSTNTTATGVSFVETLVGQTLVAGSFNVSPIAVNDVFTAVGNTQLLVGGATGLSGPSATLAGNLLANDFNVTGDNIPGFTVTTVGAFATSGGGTVTINANGSFSYNPAAGFSGADTFSYTIGDTGGLTSTATATINITAADTVWYVDAAYAGANGASDGTSARPFTSLAQVNGAGGVGDVDSANQTIYVRGNQTADFVLESGQSLIGNATALVVGGYTLTTAGAANTLSHSTGIGVLLNTNNTLSGFNIAGTNNAGTGLADNNGSVGTLTVTNVNITGSGKAVDIDQGGTLAVALGTLSSSNSTSEGVHLQGVSGTFAATTGVIDTSTGVGFLIGASGGGTASSGGNATISYGGNLNGNGGTGIEIQDRTGGTVTFSGNMTDAAGQGIVADGNSGTINFSGQISLNSGASNAITLTNNAAAINFTPTGTGLDITTTTGNGFIVDGGGGTVTLTGSGNSVATTSGRAVEIDNVTIGGAGVTFQSVGVSNGTSITGIYLNNAGSGGFTITGTGTTAGSGGTISSIDAGTDGNVEQGIGIYINNTNNISLSNMNFTGDFANFGIRGVNVNNFTLRDSTAVGSGDFGNFGNSNAADEGVVSFTNLSGTALFEGNNLAGGHEDIIVIDNNTGTLNLTVRDSAANQAVIGFNGQTVGSATGNDGILVNTSGNSNTTVLIEGVQFNGARGDMIQVNASGAAVQNITIRNNIMHNAHADIVSGGGGMSITGGAGTGAGYNVTYRIEGNSIRGAEGTAMFLNHLGDAGTVSGSIINNTIGLNNGVFSDVQGSTGANNGGNGISIGLEHGTGAGNLTHAVRIEGNNIGDIRDGAGIYLRANGDGVAGAGVTRLEATIRNNVIDEMGVNSLAGIYAQVGGAGGNDDGLLGVNIELNNINMTGATNSVATMVFDDLSNNGQFYFPGYTGPYTDAGLRTFHSGPEGNTLTHPLGVNSHVITSPTGTFATGSGFVLTVPAAAAPLSPKDAADWEAELRLLQSAALDDHLASLIADEASLVALAHALAAQVSPVGIEPIPPTPQSGETLSVGPFNLPNGQTVTIQWRATIDPQSNGLIVNPVNSGTVTASGPFPGTTQTNVVTTNLDTLTLGGQVWLDNGAGGGISGNGLLDGTEAGINGLTVALFVDANNDDIADTPGSALLTTTTAGGGLYSFAGLAPGNYIVRVTPGGLASSPGSVDPDNNVDGDDNGNAVSGGFIFSNAITLAYNTEPTPGTGNDTNNTLDFALIPPDQEPTLTATAANTAYTEGGAAAGLFNDVIASTVESGQSFTSLTLTVTNVTDGAAELLNIDGSDVALTNGNGVVTATNGLNVAVTLVGSTATVTFSGASLSAAQLKTLIEGLTYRVASENPTDANRVFTITQLVDSGSNVAPNNNTATLNIASTVNVNPVNDAPVIDLNGAAAGVNNTAAYTEQAPGFTLASGLTLTDADNSTLTGAIVQITAGFVPLAGDGADYLGIGGSGSGTINGITYSYNALTGILTLSGTASVADYRAALAQVTFQSTTNNPGTSRTVTWTVTDGTDTSAAATTTITVTAVDDSPVTNAPGAQNGTEDTDLVFSAANGNALTVSDVDSASTYVALFVNNGTLTLSQTTGLTFLNGSNGSSLIVITGTVADINAALNGLIYRGNLNYEGTDTLTFQASRDGLGVHDQDQIGITLADDGVINGDAGNNTLNGTPLADFFDLRQGGDDNVSGQGGNDGFYFGGAYTSADTVDGGAGSLDQIGLQGNYSGGVTLGSLLNTELVVLLPGNDTRFGDTAGNVYDYLITADAGTIVSNNKLIIQANLLRAGEDLTFNGSASSIDFLIYGGLGTDNLTGGSGNDGFFFGQGRFGASDVVNGGAGNMDQLGLQGNFTITFGAAQMSGIEFLVLLSASDNRFGSSGGTVSYDLTMNDANVAAGQTLIVSANTLRSGENLSFNGSAETNGRFEIYSGDGNDVITGGAGDDLIFGGGRGDTLTGGGGNDIFAYRAVTDSNSTERDGIQDFNAGDRIDLSRIDANTNVAGNQDFTYIASNAFDGQAGQLRIQNVGGNLWQVLGDTNGDTVADLDIFVVYVDGQFPSINDFIGVNAAAQEPLKSGIDGTTLLVMDAGGPDMLKLDGLGPVNDGGSQGGYLDIAFARDFGGPAMVNLFDGDGEAALASLGPADDLTMIIPTYDMTL